MLNSSIPLMAKGIDGLKMLDDGSQIAQLWKSQKTDSELNRLYKETNGDLDKMLEIGKTSPMARFVMPQLQAQQAAQQKAALDQQKIEAEIGKTNSEAFKNNQQGGGYKLENAQKQLGAIQSAVQQASMTGDKGAAIIGLDAAKRVGLISQEDYDQQYKLLSVMTPEQVKAYAQSVTFANAKDPASLIFTTADNELDNKTAVSNAQLSATVQREKIKQDGQIAQEKLSLDQAKLEQEQKKGTVQQFGDGLYMVYPNGSAVPISSPTGQPIIKSNPALKATIEEERQRTQKVSVTLDEVDKLLDDATGSIVGRGVDYVGRFFGGATDGDIATAKLGTLGGQLVALMPKMSGPQSDKDVEMYKQMAGKLDDPTIPVEMRKAALGTIRELNNKYSQMNEARGQGVPYANASSNTQPLSGAQSKGFQSLIEKHTK